MGQNQYGGFLAAAALAVATSPLARAEEGESPNVVIVTAQKRAEAINKVGLSISAFTADQLRNEGINTLSDLGAITSGLTVTEAGPTGVPIYTLRGVGFSDYATSSSSTVGLYADEVSMPYAVMSNGALFDISRVEVLKGPQGDLYGRNTTAGQINFITAKPTRDRQAGLSADYGRFGILDLEGYASGAISDKVLGRFAFKKTDTIGNDAWQESISRPGDKLGKKDVSAMRGLLNFIINDDAKFLLNVHWNENKSENTAPTAFDGRIIGHAVQQLPTLFDISRYFSTGNNRAADWSPAHRPGGEGALKGLSGKLEWDFAQNLNLVAITAYDKFTRAERFEWDGTPHNTARTKNGTDMDVFSQELRLSSTDTKAPLSWMAGLYYSSDKLGENYDFTFPESVYGFGLGIPGIHTHYDQKTTSAAAFGHAEWKFADRFKLTLGARYTKENRKWTGCTYDTGDGGLAGAWNNILIPAFILPSGLPSRGAAVTGGCGVYDDIAGTADYGKFAVFSREISAGKWQGKVGLDYSPNKDTLIYANVSRGFKSGGFNGAASNFQSQLLPYKPEQLTAYELGLKTNWLENRVQLTAATFYYDYVDKQEQSLAVTPVGNIGGLTNAPKSKVEGVELGLYARLSEGFSQNLNLAYVDSRFVEFQAVSQASAFPVVRTFDASGLHLPNSPLVQASATTTYEWSLANSMRMMIAGDINYKTSTTGGNRDPISGYTLVNARIGISDAAKKWTAMLYGRNIFNQYYWIASNTGNAPYVRVNGMPLTYGVNFAYKF